MKRINNIPTSRLILAVVFITLTLTGGRAIAEPGIQWLGIYLPTDVSADGSVAVGNIYDGTYETFRWTELTGSVLLGRNTSSLGKGAGLPEVSDDGQNVSATIITEDYTAVTQGIWTKGIGWRQSMPPTPPEGGLMDRAYGSCWGLSGDGTTLTGYFWRPDQPDGNAHANTWCATDSTFTHLPSPVRNCRGNDLNYDGSVVVGWCELANGVWEPAVWENGGVEYLSLDGGFTEAVGVSNDGNTIWGNAWNLATSTVEAAVWTRSPTGWQQQILGALAGTFPGYGQAICQDMAEMGLMIVGYNAFD